jgi:electron-transferring-flavoprotein dehydrogenase
MENVDLVSTDALIIGGGPSGLATAIHLADVLETKGRKRRIMVIEKGASIGSHILSGAVIRPEVFRELLPHTDLDELPFDSRVSGDSTVYLSESDSYALPFHPPYMNNEGNYVAPLGQLCRYLAEIAQNKGVEIYTGFAMDELLYEDGKVAGARTKETGVDHHGNRLKNYQPATEVRAEITILAEGTRGTLARQLIEKFGLDEGKNPQIYSLGVKELWKVPEGNIQAGQVYHTMGYPLEYGDEFGGGFIYGLSDNRVALGLVMGLDYKDPTFDPQAAMQVWKTHPFVSRILKDGKLMEFGAKTLPEGGYFSIPKFYTDNVMIVGDSAGFLTTARLKGVHLAVQSGILAAKTAAEALIKGDTSEAELSSYEKRFKESMIYEEMYPVRNFRQSFSKGMALGAMQFGVQLVTGGACLRGDLPTEPDYKTLKMPAEFRKARFKERFAGKLEFDKVLTFDKATNVYYSKTAHDEEQPVHLVIGDPDKFKHVNIKQYGAPCQYFCPAEVYELHVDKEGNEELRIHAENCVHCKTCDIKAPKNAITWVPPYGGDGPGYENM